MNKNFYIKPYIIHQANPTWVMRTQASCIYLQGLRGWGIWSVFLTGTDEHGQKIQREAEKKQRNQIILWRVIKKFKDLAKL